jgi:hypothetical protein
LRAPNCRAAGLPLMTQAWFVAARRRCVDHLRALASVRSSAEYVRALLDPSARHGAEVAGALHSAAVTAYAQVFTETRTHQGKIRYKTHALKGAPASTARSMIISSDSATSWSPHADYANLPSVMDTHQIGDLRVALTLKVKRLAGLSSRQLAERYLRHFHACMRKLEELLNTEMRELTTEAQTHAAAFNATHTVPASYTAMTRDFADLPTGNQVPEPDFAADLDASVYTTLEHTLPLISSGKYRVRDSEGNEDEVDIEVE